MDNHFVQCLNENCNTYHLVSREELLSIKENINSIESLLCEKCKLRFYTEHVVQCISCKTILEFLPLIEDESPRILFVEKCSHCGGTIEDEINIVGSEFKELFI